MNFGKSPPLMACAALLCMVCSLLPAGCKRDDINLVKKGTYEYQERTIGTAFDSCSHFISTSWDRLQYEANQPFVVFTAELPVQILLNAISEDERNWLSLEKRYFEEVSPQLVRAYLRITFPISSDRTYRLGDVMFGIASSKDTVWSPSFTPEEKENVISAIYADSPAIFSCVALYANPSFPQGSALLHTLTGKDISRAQ